VDAGADLLLGHHPGVLQPVELIDGVPVFYSLGIFLFSNMYWRGHDSLGSQFLSKVHLHSSCRKTGWVEIVLRKGMPTEFQFHPAVLTRRLTVVPEDTARRQTEWSNLGRRLETKDYNAEYAAEYRRVQSQANSQQPLARRIELRLFKYGLLPNAVEEA
jgi:poly-gamma-glutamate capsule biosynthesis protein CapA/YwtB (metallophosphatase superfamily)